MGPNKWTMKRIKADNKISLTIFRTILEQEKLKPWSATLDTIKTWGPLFKGDISIKDKAFNFFYLIQMKNLENLKVIPSQWACELM